MNWDRVLVMILGVSLLILLTFKGCSPNNYIEPGIVTETVHTTDTIFIEGKPDTVTEIKMIPIDYSTYRGHIKLNESLSLPAIGRGLFNNSTYVYDIVMKDNTGDSVVAIITTSPKVEKLPNGQLVNSMEIEEISLKGAIKSWENTINKTDTIKVIDTFKITTTLPRPKRISVLMGGGTSYHHGDIFPVDFNIKAGLRDKQDKVWYLSFAAIRKSIELGVLVPITK